jgi:hypothetical protein
MMCRPEQGEGCYVKPTAASDCAKIVLVATEDTRWKPRCLRKLTAAAASRRIQKQSASGAVYLFNLLLLQVVVDAIVEAQSNAGGNAAGVVNLGPAAGQLSLQRPVSLAGKTALAAQ